VRARVEPEAAGERLDRFLAAALGSRTAAQRAIEEGRVLVDGSRRAKNHRVAPGEEVQVAEPAESPPADSPPASFSVAWEDEHLLVVDKPAGVVTHPGAGRATGTLAQALAGRAAGGPDPSRAGIVHRLDRDTSGLLVVARSQEAHERLSDLIAGRSVRREYLALVLGRPPARSGTIDAPVGRDRRSRTLISTETDSPREARTHFVLERAAGEHTLLRVTLETGRTHQIRAHLQAIGHPVAGDPAYGAAGVLGLRRQFLHATRLAFEHPFTGEQVDVKSPLPADLRRALARASAHS